MFLSYIKLWINLKAVAISVITVKPGLAPIDADTAILDCYSSSLVTFYVKKPFVRCCSYLLIILKIKLKIGNFIGYNYFSKVVSIYNEPIVEFKVVLPNNSKVLQVKSAFTKMYTW